jgi:[ribosomal protein S18]-alanine N-acetyltransferase
LVALEQELFTNQLFASHLLSRASFRRFLASPGATLIIAQADGRLAGYVLVLYRSNSRLARMYSIGVAAHVRRRGLARTLLAAAQDAAMRRGCRAMRLEVRADDPSAIALYKTSGYHSFGRHTGYYGRIDALRFEKRLGPAPRF